MNHEATKNTKQLSRSGCPGKTRMEFRNRFALRGFVVIIHR